MITSVSLLGRFWLIYSSHYFVGSIFPAYLYVWGFLIGCETFDFYLVRCCIFLYSYKYSSTSFFCRNSVKLLQSTLIRLDLLLKNCGQNQSWTYSSASGCPPWRAACWSAQSSALGLLWLSSLAGGTRNVTGSVRTSTLIPNHFTG